MKSLDTNVLLYAINKDCPEHKACASVVEQALKEPESWIIADQVWFELYRLLRNPAVLSHHLGAVDAAAAVYWYRNKTGWLHCAWEIDMMEQVEKVWKDASFAARRNFDLVLAVTLKNSYVKEFYTRNVKDFEAFGFFTLVNPLA